MKISDMILISLRNLWRRKGRTMLTVIGVVIGSCAVIVMISLGLGMNAAMDTMLASWGDLTAVTIYNSDGGGMMMFDDGGGNKNNKDKPALDDKALETLKNIGHVKDVIPMMSLDTNMLTIVAGRNNRYKMSWAAVYGVDFSIFDKMGYTIQEGKVPDEHNKDSSMIIGIEIPYRFTDTKKHGNAAYVYRQQLSDGSYTKPFVDPLTEDVILAVNNTKKPNEDGSYPYGGRGYEFKLSGTAKLEEDPMWDTVNSIYIDIDVAKQIIAAYNKLNSVKNAKAPEYTRIKLVCDDINNVDIVQKEVEELGFNASSMASVRNQMQGELGVIQMILGGLAAISLLVAAISITNTMIMSIYERTREIGIMKVLGCFIGNIRMMFLIEAGLIGLLGGIIGTVISYIISILMNTLGGSVFSEMMGISSDGTSAVSIIPLWLVLLALVFSTVIGLISGYYPANRAVKISALEAIKNE